MASCSSRAPPTSSQRLPAVVLRPASAVVLVPVMAVSSAVPSSALVANGFPAVESFSLGYDGVLGIVRRGDARLEDPHAGAEGAGHQRCARNCGEEPAAPTNHRADGTHCR